MVYCNISAIPVSIIKLKYRKKKQGKQWKSTSAKKYAWKSTSAKKYDFLKTSILELKIIFLYQISLSSKEKLDWYSL